MFLNTHICLRFFQQGGKGRSRGVEALEGAGATLPVGEYDEGKRRQLQEQRHQEYVDLQEQVTMANKRLSGFRAGFLK